MSQEAGDQPAKTPRTPRAPQLEIVRRNIAALDRIGYVYAANRQREFLARLEREGGGE